MFKVENKVVYKAFGLTMISEVPLSELSHVDDEVDSIDIEVELADLSELWSKLSERENQIVIFKENTVMFRVPNVAIFSIQEGRLITVSPLEEYEDDVGRLYILGSCMGIILMQRKILPLHGSAVAINGKAYAIIGDSGAGKSTLATALLNRGFQLLTDDVIAVSLCGKDSIPYVTPAYPQQKLWQESLTEFGMSNDSYRPVYQRETKFAIPVSSQFSSELLPLAGVFELVKVENDDVNILPIENLTRLQTLFNHTYRSFLIPSLGLTDWHFVTSTKIISHINMFQLQRPISRFTAHQLVSVILNTIHKEEIKC